jgi:hypothetical protein
MRILFWVLVWILSLGSMGIEVEYTDGLKIKLKGWATKNDTEKPRTNNHPPRTGEDLLKLLKKSRIETLRQKR